MLDDPLRSVLKTFVGRKFLTDEPSSPFSTADTEVVVEAPVVIAVEGVDQFTLMCIPLEKRFLAAGFLLTEGFISGLRDIDLLYECEDDPTVVQVRLGPKALPRTENQRNLTISASCGACGTRDLEAKIAELPKVGNSLKLERNVFRAVVMEIKERQPLFARTGGTHWAGIYTAGGELTACAEDIGRHNALDKAVGKCLLSNTPTANKWAFLSGRVSMEMVSKCARVGIELVSAISAPTSLAVEIAERCGITLCAFVRENRATVFSCPERIEGVNGRYPDY